MKITFLGVGSAFTTQQYYQSNLLVTAPSGARLLLDCGCDARFSLGEYGINAGSVGREIQAVYISHLHADHVGGMEWLAFSTCFGPYSRRLLLFAEAEVMRCLWEHSLRGGLECVDHRDMLLTDYFRCRPQGEDGTFSWEGLNLTLVKMPHILGFRKHLYSYGLLIRQTGGGGSSVFITTDTQFRPRRLAGLAETVDLVFHDCETAPVPTTAHAHYGDLRTLPLHVKEKTWLYHYQPGDLPDAAADGFRGFVRKGQEFALSD